MDSEEAQSYLLSRGSSREQWVRHSIGFTRGDFEVESNTDPNHSNQCFIKEKKYLRCDTCRYRNWSAEWIGEEDGSKEQIVGRRIQNSIVLPLTSYSGTIVGFQIRSLAEKKYDTFVVRRRPEAFAFGLASAVQSIWSTKEVYLCEGPFDHQVIERLVVPNVLSLTTSSVDALLSGFLKRFVNRIYFCLDNDKAGTDGYNSFVKYHGSEFDIINIKCPKKYTTDKDPNEFWSRVGDKKFTEHFDRS